MDMDERILRPIATGAAPCPVFVINLARDHARRAWMERQLAGARLEADFFAAIPGDSLTTADLARVDPAGCARFLGRSLLPAEIGCYLSHYRLYERIMRENIPAALILEDDVALDPGLPELLGALLSMPFQDWHVLRLATSRLAVTEPSGARFVGQRQAVLPGGAAVYRLGTHVLGAAAYLVKREGAAHLLRLGCRIDKPIDLVLDRFWENGIPPLVVRPFPVQQVAEMESRIGPRPAGREVAQGWRKSLPRRIQRLRDAVAKRVYLAWSDLRRGR